MLPLCTGISCLRVRVMILLQEPFQVQELKFTVTKERALSVVTAPNYEVL